METTAARRKKILIIDDNPAVRFMLERLLSERRYDVVLAEEGLDGLYKAKQEKPDLILLDILLPGMDGFKVCRMIKFDAALRKTPVLILTSRMTDQDKAMASSVGADGFITKATGTEIILNEIRRLTQA